MPHLCCTSTCKSKSIAKCPCCNKQLCRAHFLQHDLTLRSKFHRFNEQIEEMMQQYQTLNIKKITNEFILQLDRWRVNSYRIIDEFYQKKYNEVHDQIHQLFIKQEEGIIQLRSQLVEAINQQKIAESSLNVLTIDIQNLKQQINQVKRVSVQFDINPLIFADDLINIHPLKAHSYDFSEFTSPYQKIARVPFSSDALASNDQFLLVHQNSNLYLIDENLFVKNQKKWPHGYIRDISWSQTLKAFFLITFDEIYLVKQDSFKIKHIKSIQGQSWQCCTCSDTSLYLTKDLSNATIDEYSLTSSIKLLKRHDRIETRDEKERIDSMEYSNETLAVAINNQTKEEIFVELRSTGTFDRLWRCQLSIEYTQRRIQCCWFDYQTLTVTERDSSSIFQISDDGNVADVIKYKDNIQYLNLFGTNILVITCRDSINFHQL